MNDAPEIPTAEMVKELRGMAAQILSPPDSKGKHLFLSIADRLEQMHGCLVNHELQYVRASLDSLGTHRAAVAKRIDWLVKTAAESEDPELRAAYKRRILILTDSEAVLSYALEDLSRRAGKLMSQGCAAAQPHQVGNGALGDSALPGKEGK